MLNILAAVGGIMSAGSIDPSLGHRVVLRYTLNSSSTCWLTEHLIFNINERWKKEHNRSSKAVSQS